ncbi:Nucleoporin nup49/NSP49 (Nuclear pore protein nup49/NSP49) [Fusarium falciforme]|uniref:Nucleoporin nup49/NSP49 (Nuclear pore protein nup49/NSP49) n=1 Tax=Fusarium falciforme TaxID=195108 RepID=A0A9W8RG88_9HYPO|nr:Nucleoporin nup49/NSP49 (Nuclear pore protein nup49/NSP49) [Fusarium falciforme]
MSLTRSASGPAGGLTINTGAANAFGATASKPSAAGTLFGSAANTPNNTTTAPAGASTMSTAGSLFGGGAQKTGTGLFGGAASTTASTGGGLFGNTQAATPAPATGGLFGTAPATTTTTTGGLFGNTAAKPAATGTGLFGNPAAATQQTPAGGLLSATTTATSLGTPTPTGQKPAGGGLFGNTATAQAAPATGTTSLFGGQKPAGSGLFGGAAPAQQTTTAQNTSTFGQPAAQVSAVQINYDNIRHRTRFDDLAKPVQDEIALLDKGIQRVIKMRDEIGEFMPQHEKDIEQLGRDVSFVESKFRIVDAALNNDVNTVKNLHDQTRKNAADARLCFRGADNLKLPAHYHQTGLFASQAPTANSNGGDAASTHADAQDLITYFNRICDDIEKSKARLDEYRGSIERDMPGVENGLYEQIRSLRDRSTTSIVVQDKLNEVLLALRDTGNAIIYQAGQIADTRERLSRLQAGIVDSGVYGLSMNA